MLKNLVLLTAVLYTALITIMNFISLDSVPQFGWGFEDKIYHVGAYAVFSFLWALWRCLRLKKNNLKILTLCCVGYGIVLELVQHAVNPNRTFDPLDLLSNCTGVIIGIIFVWYYFTRIVNLKQ